MTDSHRLNRLVATSTVFYQRLRTFHWNVRGPHFFDLHTKFEELYTRWNETIDLIAERALTIGGKTPATLAQILEHSALKETPEIPDGRGMVERVVADMETLLTEINAVAGAAEEARDAGTFAVMDGIREATEKDLWMLKAWLG